MMIVATLQKLENAGFDRKQAEALVESFATDLDQLATQSGYCSRQSGSVPRPVVAVGGLRRYHRRTVDDHAGNRVKGRSISFGEPFKPTVERSAWTGPIT